MALAAFVIIAFFCGSLPFSVWIGRLFLGLDVRSFGDGNPGATNVFRAGSKPAGFAVLLLDVSKAAAPVGIAYFNLGMRGAAMFLIAIAPILGHAFSPFLGFRGGKALSTSFGVWIGLTVWKASLPGVIGALVGLAIFTRPGWAVLLGLAGILVALLLWIPDPLFLLVLAAESLLLAWTYRGDLGQRPRFRPWLAQRFSRLRS
jgi:glycerol-3-phosphate acyltransferase PlsY